VWEVVDKAPFFIRSLCSLFLFGEKLSPSNNSQFNPLPPIHFRRSIHSQKLARDAMPRRVGDLLLAVSLSDEAENAYQSALDSASALGYFPIQAAAHAKLSELRSNREEHLKMAINLYEELGDEMMANELREELP
jgi:hypothetical protein